MIYSSTIEHPETMPDNLQTNLQPTKDDDAFAIKVAMITLIIIIAATGGWLVFDSVF